MKTYQSTGTWLRHHYTVGSTHYLNYDYNQGYHWTDTNSQSVTNAYYAADGTVTLFTVYCVPKDAN